MNLTKHLNCFKAYDVRGKLNEELNEDIAYRIARSTAQVLKAKSVVVGFDARETSPILAQAVSRGLLDAGADVFNIGLSGTEEMYSAVTEFSSDAGIEITASHNPIEYNGMKIVKFGSKPVSQKELSDIKLMAEKNDFVVSTNKHSGSIFYKKSEARKSYISKITDFIDLQSLQPIKIVINSGNGAAGPVIDALDEELRLENVRTNFVRLHHKPDPSFPNGIPNPLIEENRHSTSSFVRKEEASFGVAFDGDFDRCFIFDHLGNFIPGEYIVGLLAEIFLKEKDGNTIIHDPRVIWNTQDIVSKCGGKAVVSKTGHAFLKSAMREQDAIYGGEMSAHHYFRDFYNCDSGMIPWLLIWGLLSKEKIMLADLISERKNRFPSSGEINFQVGDPPGCMELVRNIYNSKAIKAEEIDGLSMDFDNWRFNLRRSNTEPFVRLNVETKADKPLLKSKVKELTDLITSY